MFGHFNSSKRLALHDFVTMHPPQGDVRPAAPELLAEFEGRLPERLLELWQKKGLGFYGDDQIALIDPRVWQATLDRWIITPPDDVERIPIALMPLGALLYYRRLTATDEDVAYIDPVSKETDILAWSLEDCFNTVLYEPESFDEIVSRGYLMVGRDTCGPLLPGEVYEADATLLIMQMLRVQKVDALAMHRRLRDALDAPTQRDEPPTTVADALPAAMRALFDDIAENDDPRVGLYLSSYIDWHRMLALLPDHTYVLLLWKIHHKTFERMEISLYEGTWQPKRTSDGDLWAKLDIKLRDDSHGSDGQDDELYLVQSGGQTLLLQAQFLKATATAIAGWGGMDRSDHYFVRVRLDDAWRKADGERPAPPLADLPVALRKLIPDEPFLATITHVEEPYDDYDPDDSNTLMCTLDLGEADGLRMNMPFWSPAETGRGLVGWVWGMDPHACRIGIRYTCGPDGTITHGPRVGDVLTSRQPKQT